MKRVTWIVSTCVGAALMFGAAVVRAESSSTPASASASYTIYLATAAADGSIDRAGDRSEFDCRDVVYLVVESEGVQAHEMSAYWIDPAGKERVRAQRGFEQDRGRWWAWSGLKLNPPSGSSLFGMFDPSNGLEDFIGSWQVHVEVGPHRMTTIKFSVLC